MIITPWWGLKYYFLKSKDTGVWVMRNNSGWDATGSV